MNAPILFMPFGQDRAVAELAAAVLEDGASASVVAPEGAGKTAVLNRLAAELAGGQARVVRVACPAVGGLSLPAFLSQVLGRAKGGVLSDEDLELASDILTQADVGCSQIALLVDDAHDLLPPALRYIQLACRSGPLLRVVLAGRPGTLELLRGDEFAFLRQRISRNIQLSPLSATRMELPALLDEAPVAQAPAVAPPARRRGGPAWALAGLGMAASITLVVWLNRQDEPPAASVASISPQGAPALARMAETIDPPPSVAMAEALSAPEPTVSEADTPTAHAEASPPAVAEAEQIPLPEPATPREAAALQPAPEAQAKLVEVARPATELAATGALPAPEELAVAADPPSVVEAATPREAAALQPAPEAQPTTELSMADASSTPGELAAAALPAHAIEVATPREAAALEPMPEPSAAVAELPVAPRTSEPAAVDAPLPSEPPAAVAAVGTVPLEAEPVVAGTPLEAEPAAIVAGTPAAAPTDEPPAIAVGLITPFAPEPAVAEAAPTPLAPEAFAPVVASLPEPSAPSSNMPAAPEAEPVVAILPTPPAPVPVPALAVIAVPEAPRRVPKPSRAGPERVAAVDGRVDERRCRDIVLRAQLGEDITNADRQFLRAGCRPGR